MLDYVRFLNCEIGVLLQEKLFPVLKYLYLDLVRAGVRDHLKDHGFGLSEETSRFSSELLQSLGKFGFLFSFKSKTVFDLIVNLRLGSLLREFGTVRVEFNRDSCLTAIRVYDVEPYTDSWDRDLPFTNQISNSHIRLVSSNLKSSFQISCFSFRVVNTLILA